MGKRSLRRKNTRRKMHSKKTKTMRRTINKRSKTRKTRKLCVHCKCKLCHCGKMHKKKSRSRKLRGGGALHLGKLVPQDFKNVWTNMEHGFQTLGSKMSGTTPPQPPSAVDQPYLVNQKMDIPTRINIGGSYASASSQVNNALNSV
jgi:hypothetical protein